MLLLNAPCATLTNCACCVLGLYTVTYLVQKMTYSNHYKIL